jgi:hypothetical protein
VSNHFRGVWGWADDRFEMLHARAIGWPEDRFEYLGIDDDGDTTAHYAGEVRPNPFLDLLS